MYWKSPGEQWVFRRNDPFVLRVEEWHESLWCRLTKFTLVTLTTVYNNTSICDKVIEHSILPNRSKRKLPISDSEEKQQKTLRGKSLRCAKETYSWKLFLTKRTNRRDGLIFFFKGGGGERTSTEMNRCADRAHRQTQRRTGEQNLKSQTFVHWDRREERHTQSNNYFQPTAIKVSFFRTDRLIDWQ